MNETFGIAGDGECPPRAIWLTTQNVDRLQGEVSSGKRCRPYISCSEYNGGCRRACAYRIIAPTNLPLVLVNVGMLRRAIETLPDVPDNLEHLCCYYILFSTSRANAIIGKHFNCQPGTERQAIGNRSYAWTTYLSHIE